MAARGRRELPDDPPPEARNALDRARRRAAMLEGSGSTLEAWFRAITRMHRRSVKHGLGLHQLHHDILVSPDGNLLQIGHETVRVLEPQPKLRIGDVYNGPSIVYPDARGELIPLSSVGELIPCASLPVMVINLAATDEHILAEVERVLRARKKAKGLHLTPEARPLTRSLRSSWTLERWRKHHIVELVEMLAWSKAGMGRRYPKHLIGRWINPDRLGTSKYTSDAIAVARQAIALLPEIMAEVNKPVL